MVSEKYYVYILNVTCDHFQESGYTVHPFPGAQPGYVAQDERHQSVIQKHGHGQDVRVLSRPRVLFGVFAHRESHGSRPYTGRSSHDNFSVHGSQPRYASHDPPGSGDVR